MELHDRLDVLLALLDGGRGRGRAPGPRRDHGVKRRALLARRALGARGGDCRGARGCHALQAEREGRGEGHGLGR